MKRPVFIFLIISLFVILNACAPGEVKLKIISTTDVHGAFFPVDPITGIEHTGSMAKVSSYIKTIRQENEESVILLDNGDILQGDPSVYYYNFEDSSRAHLFTDIMHYLQYDAATIGNHDIETGHPVYDRIKQELSIPWLAANCINTQSEKPYFSPYSIINKQGVKIAVLGLITPRIPDWLPENIWSGMRFDDMIESAKAWVPHILDEEKPDLMVGLFHAGVEYNYNNQDAQTHKNENAVKLVAQQVPGFDVIFAGHDHKTWNEYQIDPEGDSVLVLGSTSKARELAIANLTLTKNGRKWIVQESHGHIASMRNVEPDQDYIAYFDPQIEAVKRYVNLEIGELETPLSTPESFFGPSAFMTFIHHVQLTVGQVDISMAAPLSYNTNLPARTLKVDDLFALYRFENLLYTMELTGKEILDYLTYSYRNWFTHMTDSSDHLLNLLPDGNGGYRTATAYYNFDSAQGIDYEVDVKSGDQIQVRIKQLSSGEPFSLNETYRVAINSYRGNGGGGHLLQGAGIPKEELNQRIVGATDKDLRYYMKSYIQDQKIIRVNPVNNWEVVPGDWAASGRKKDYNLLFAN